MQNLIENNEFDTFDTNDIPNTLMFLYMKLTSLQQTTSSLEKTVIKLSDIIEPIVEEKKVEYEIKKKSEETRQKRRGSLQNASIGIGIILTFLTVLKTVDDIYLAHQSPFTPKQVIQE